MLTYPAVDPVALTLGPLKIHWYGITYVVGIGLAWWLLRRRAVRDDLLRWPPEAVDDMIFYGALGIIIGGRLGSILFYHLPYYLDHPLEIIRVDRGGMSFHGGLLGATVSLLWFAKRHGYRFFNVIDFIAPVVPIGLLCGRLGNFINGELWGAPTEVPWAMVFPHVDDLPRHPSQLYEAIFEGAILFLILWCYTSRPRPTMAASGMFLLGYGIFRSLIELVREPDPHLGYLASDWLTMGQLLCVPMIVLGVSFLIIAYRPPKAASGKPRSEF